MLAMLSIGWAQEKKPWQITGAERLRIGGFHAVSQKSIEQHHRIIEISMHVPKKHQDSTGMQGQGWKAPVANTGSRLEMAFAARTAFNMASVDAC